MKVKVPMGQSYGTERRVGRRSLSDRGGELVERRPRPGPVAGTTEPTCGMISRVGSDSRGGRILSLFVVAVGVSLSGSAAPGGSGPSGHGAPVTVLHDAIAALLRESRYSLTLTDSKGGPGGTPSVYKVDIQNPDRISITGSENVIAIGSTGYFKAGPYGWTTVHHDGESTNLTNDMLMYIDILKRATSASRSGDTYTVPPTEATRLLVTTGLPRFQSASDVSLSAVLGGGLVKSVSLHVGGPSPISTTTTVADVADFPAVDAPPTNHIISGQSLARHLRQPGVVT